MISIKSASLKNKNVLLRVDWNVPISDDGKILDDFRIRQTLPTFKYLLKSGVDSIRVITHLGRPKGKGFEKKYSLAPIIKRFEHLFGAGNSQIEIWENIRFDQREEENAKSLVKELTAEMDIFVSDGLAVAHRKHASVYGVARELPSYAGLLLEREVERLEYLRIHPRQPFVVLIGGAKYEDKAQVIDALLSKAKHILIGGAVANEIIKSQNYEKYLKRNVIFPLDGKPEFAGMLDIGDKTIQRFEEILREAKTVFWAGAMGKFEDYRYAKGTEKIAKFLANSRASTFVAGGDTVEKIHQMRLADKFTFLSTGGSASLQLIAGEKLPGLEVLN
ncbi:MAG: phosphoglycerate kinase [Candidatus Berkelbacteria bacterium Licking1014_85]|uniref:Phosphoglycerate kinase n=1 Tax=Candidatus Berkelbacteria bacterium Licking1014_85 TaxID=2017148 RepID=A0A554LJ45_9BACT|nr:MAG: phosphoglycerate kinase [Candidatus Berkelbacteria bacterium Licking1014_85]